LGQICDGKVKDIYKSKELWRGPESIYRKEVVLALSGDKIRPLRDEDLCLLILDITIPKYIVRERGKIDIVISRFDRNYLINLKNAASQHCRSALALLASTSA
jgi:hypothetical protein